MQIRTVGPVLAIAASLATVAGCGGPCAQVARARTAAIARPPAAPGPHLRLRAPFAVLDRMLADALVDQPVVPIELERLGPLRPLLGALAIVPREVRLGAAAPGRVHLSVTLELRGATGPILTFAAGGELDPTIERDGDRTAITLGLTPARIDRIELALGADLTARLGQALAARLPDEVRRTVPQFVIDRVAAAVAEELAGRTWSLLRRTLLPRLGELTRIRIALPPIPIEAIALTSTSGPAGALDLAITTALPVRTTVAEAGPLTTESLELVATGSALAELGNWAIASGYAPARYDRSLVPAEGGDFVPRFDWRAGHPRPLLVHVDRVADGCEWYTVGVTPTLALRDGALVAGASERTFERKLGPAYLRAAAWLKELLQGAVSRRLAAGATITVGERPVVARLRAVVLDGDGLTVAADVEIGPVEPK
jgi:hypothetical protein